MISGWFKIKEFCNDSQEFHALVDGFGVVMFPLFLLRQEFVLALLEHIEDELHYALFGGFLGVWMWVGIIALLVRVVF